jgi:zinc protease
VQTTEANLAPSLALVAEILREPVFPEADFEQVKQQRIATRESGRTEPNMLASLALERALNPYPRTDVRYIGTIDEDIDDLKKVTLDDVRKFYRDFYGASHGELVVIGQFEPAALRKSATELLGNWPSPAPYKRITDAFLKIDPINTKIETPDKQNAMFQAGLVVRMSDTDPDYPAMVLANYMFGGSNGARLFRRIRNAEGLSYTVNSRFSAPTEGDYALLNGLAISNPINSPKVEASFKDELARTLRDGFTPEEVADAKNAIREERMVGRSQDAQLLRVLAIRAEYGRTMQWDTEMDAKLAALTPEQVNAAFRRHVDPSAISIVKAGDFKAAGVYQ